MIDKVKQKPKPTPTDVFELIHGVMHRFRASQYRRVRDCAPDLTHAEGKVLLFFARNPGATLSDLSARTGQDKGQMVRVIRTLQRAGLLAGRKDESDGRKVTLTVTTRGRNVQKLLEDQHQKLERIAVRGLDAGERAALISILEKVRTNLDGA